MRSSAIAAAIFALSTINHVLVADDFSALLADLSFGDAPAASEPLSVAQAEPLADLKPVPTGIVMPEMIESSSQNGSASEQAMIPELAGEAPLAPNRAEPGPQVALQNPIPAVPEVDLDAALALQDPPQIQSGIPSQTIGHTTPCHSGNCDCMGDTITCVPRTKVNLPSSTLYQYFRSNACYTKVWDNYSQHCSKHMIHVRGECDCYQKSQEFQAKWNSYFGHHGSGCASCDAGCDQ